MKKEGLGRAMLRYWVEVCSLISNTLGRVAKLYSIKDSISDLRQSENGIDF